MSLLSSLYSLTEASTDMSQLPDDVVAEIQKNIRDGAKDLQQLWANALELVQKAYEVAGVQRPTPDMKSAWTQYEENLQYAVEQLAKFRGMKGDWRMSSAIFREAMEKTYKFRVIELSNKFGHTHVINAKSLDEVIDIIKNNADQHDVKIDKSKDPENPNMAMISFSKWGIRKNYKVKIQQVL